MSGQYRAIFPKLRDCKCFHKVAYQFDIFICLTLNLLQLCSSLFLYVLNMTQEQGQATPLPWKALLVVCAVRLAEPISATMCFPFLPFVSLSNDRVPFPN